MTAADEHRARVEAVNAQQARLSGARRPDFWEGQAARFRMDPRRKLDRNMEALASLIEPGDVVVDVGGGAGRTCLPLALRCREVINVEPSQGMGEQFLASAREAGIANAQLVPVGWLEAEGVEGDVLLAFNVTYFIPDIVPFISKLAAAARRRVIIGVWSVPPPNADAPLFRLVHGEDQLPLPGHRELLPVLWEMGILPDIQVLPEQRNRGALPATREDAVKVWSAQLSAGDRERAAAVIDANFDALFERTPEGYRPAWREESRELLITWET